MSVHPSSDGCSLKPSEQQLTTIDNCYRKVCTLKLETTPPSTIFAQSAKKEHPFCSGPPPTVPIEAVQKSALRAKPATQFWSENTNKERRAVLRHSLQPSNPLDRRPRPFLPSRAVRSSQAAPKACYSPKQHAKITAQAQEDRSKQEAATPFARLLSSCDGFAEPPFGPGRMGPSTSFPLPRWASGADTSSSIQSVEVRLPARLPLTSASSGTAQWTCGGSR